jgi:hypothetical protein
VFCDYRQADSKIYTIGKGTKIAKTILTLKKKKVEPGASGLYL